ncbi:glutathione peroxidase [Paraflavisolibacter sp. H34]|uniref:glutathione peroxidase n=1 Tax=Huijunlia imazamoxiresistens TaxID=3127457 RepID=UPI003017D8F9
MTLRQKLLQRIYPLVMRLSKGEKRGKIRTNSRPVPPPVSFYGLTATGISGEELPFSRWKNKKVLLVNTASNCGYTAQYDELQSLYERYQDVLVIIAFPANDFKDQEPGSDAAIAAFCRARFGVTFPVTRKTQVAPGKNQHPVFRWLTEPGQNGWNSQAPDWNFSKYLVSGQGILTHYFGPAVSPLCKEMLQAIDQ